MRVVTGRAKGSDAVRFQALRKSEQMLEEDALRFDQFLKDNDQKAVQAIKKAEAETKAKAEKVQEIKKLNAQITQIKSEMSKFEEQLDDCRKCGLLVELNTA